MFGLVANNILRFVFLVLFQAVILNNIELGGYVNPYLYILFILWLPFEMQIWLTLLLGFLLGFFMDLFTGTFGLHISACVFLAYCRSFVLKVLAPREGYEFGLRPNIQDMGIPWFIAYSGILIILHHSALFFMEAFRFGEFFYTLFRVFLSSIPTFVLVTLCQFFTYKEKSRL